MTLPQWVRQLLRPLSRMGDRCLPPHPPLQCWHTGGGAGPAMQDFSIRAAPHNIEKGGPGGLATHTLHECRIIKTFQLT